MRGGWLDELTGIPDAHLIGEHLLLPGYGPDHPTLEIYQYDQVESAGPQSVNQCGFAHLAFEVDDVEDTLGAVLLAGGGQIGQVVNTQYEDGRKAIFVYASDIEGNIIELQSWS